MAGILLEAGTVKVSESRAGASLPENVRPRWSLFHSQAEAHDAQSMAGRPGDWGLVYASPARQVT